jgi:hypothetical protein
LRSYASSQRPLRGLALLGEFDLAFDLRAALDPAPNACDVVGHRVRIAELHQRAGHIAEHVAIQGRQRCEVRRDRPASRVRISPPRPIPILWNE